MRTVASILFGLVFAAGASGATVDGIEINWISEGNGPAIVFVHGLTCDTTVWVDQIEGLKDEYRVIALDLPGHGDSGSPESGPFTMTLFARAIEAVRAEAGLEEMVLVGHSMGGSVIGKYALMYPKRVAGLVGVDTDLRPPAAVPQVSDEQSEQFLAQRPARNRDERERMVRSMFVADTPEAIQKKALDLMLGASDELSGRIGISMSTFGSVDNVTINAPATVILAGNNSRFDDQRLWEFVPGAKLEKITATGHFLMMEKPQEFNRRLREFLKGIDF